MEKTYVQNKLEQIKREGYGLHLEGILSNAFDIHKKSILPGLVATLLYVLVMMVVGLSTFGMMYGMNINEFMEVIQKNPQALEASVASVSLTSKILYALISAVVGALVMPLLSGLYKVAYHTQFGVNGTTSDLFAYYKGSHFTNIFIYTFIYTFVLQLLNLGLAQAIPAGGAFIGILIQVILSVTFILTIPFIVFGNMNWIEAIKSSTLITSKNWFFLLFILAISFLIVLVGIFFCGIGILFTYPFMYFVTFVLYDKIIGFPNENDDISKIGEF